MSSIMSSVIQRNMSFDKVEELHAVTAIIPTSEAWLTCEAGDVGFDGDTVAWFEV